MFLSCRCVIILLVIFCFILLYFFLGLELFLCWCYCLHWCLVLQPSHWCCSPCKLLLILTLFYCYSSSHCVVAFRMLVFDSPYIDSCYVILFALLCCSCIIVIFFILMLLHYFSHIVALFFLLALMCCFSCVALFFSCWCAALLALSWCSSYVATLFFSCCCSFHAGVIDLVTTIQVPIDPTFLVALLALALLLFPWLVWYFPPFLSWHVGASNSIHLLLVL